MPSALDLRRRIRSVKSTRQITKAMKMVSAAKLRRAQERAISARPFARMLTNVMRSLATRTETLDPRTDQPRHPLLARREEKNILLVVITGDKGLAGAFNTNVLKAGHRFVETRPGQNVDLVVVGRKGRDFLRRRYPVAPEGEGQPRAGVVQVAKEYVNIFSRLEFTHARELAEEVIGRYTRVEVDAVYLVYNEFRSVISQRLVVSQLLPIKEFGVEDIEMAEEMTLEQKQRVIEAARATGINIFAPDTGEIDRRAGAIFTGVDYIYEQPAEQIFHHLLPRYVSLNLFHVLLESVAAEHAARMTAMDSATNNASKMIDGLTLAMNRARQARITREIIEIVSGAAAL
jgi:F-type H+-transporting ATPase subunit gamma